MVHLGTTLNLLKFPIINPTPYRMFRRQERLHEVSRQTESELSEDELRRLKHFSRQGYLVGKTGGDKGEERGPVQNQNCFYLPNVQSTQEFDLVKKQCVKKGITVKRSINKKYITNKMPKCSINRNSSNK